MSRESDSLRLLRVIDGSYKPSMEDAHKLAERARLNKLYLAYLRGVGDLFKDELKREETRYEWYIKNAVEVIKALKSVNYALYKFRRPVDHVSVDLDILVNTKEIPKAVKLLRNVGFNVVVPEPYTITVERKGFIVDLYTMPAFAWVVYMDGKKLLKEHAEDIDVYGTEARALSREAEVAVAAAHAVYKEHMVLLMDCLVMWNWLNKEVWKISIDYDIETALEEVLGICSLVKNGFTEAPCKLNPSAIFKAYAEKMIHDPAFRATFPNIIKYISSRENAGSIIINRLSRKSY